MTDATSANTGAETHEVGFEEAYERLMPEFLALNRDELVAVNLDIVSAAATVLGAHPRILELVPQIAELPRFRLEPITKLDQYAMALSHAQTRFLGVSRRSDSLLALVDRGVKVREALLADARALVQRGLLNGAPLKNLKGARGYLNLAVDLQLLAAVFGDRLPELEVSWGTRQEELLDADQIAAGILRAVGLRKRRSLAIAEATDMRMRAFTLCTRFYDQARRALSYLRWAEEDADVLVPSLYRGRGGRGRRKERGADAARASAILQGASAASDPPAESPGSNGSVRAYAPNGNPGSSPFVS